MIATGIHFGLSVTRLHSAAAASALDLPRTYGPVLEAMSRFRWRVVFVAVVCLVISSGILAQASVLEYRDLAAIASGWLDYYLQCLGFGFAILFALTAVEPMARRLPPFFRPLAFILAIGCGALAGGLLDVYLHDLGDDYIGSARFAGDVLRWVVTGGAIVGIYAFERRASRSAARVHASAIAQAALDRQMLEARLQLMRAQIEPHFLFNTLANVRRLCQHDVGRGVTLLDNLARYLRAALPQLRAGAMTLGQEADLVHAYLDVLQIRMGEYLGYSLEVPAALREHPFPPMMLLTLAENAIKHGLAPSPEAGRIDIVARRDGDELVVTVADTGVGFGVAKTGGTGIGLANTRARLAALYGPGGVLELAANEPRGVVARIRVPMSAMPAAIALMAMA